MGTEPMDASLPYLLIGLTGWEQLVAMLISDGSMRPLSLNHLVHGLNLKQKGSRQAARLSGPDPAATRD